MRKNFDIINVLFGLAGFVAIGYAVCAHSKLAKVSERLDKGIDEIADNMEFDIPEELINKAVERAVAVEAKKAVERATNETIAAMKKDIHTEVTKEVNRDYNDLKAAVLKEITASAAKIDTARVRRDVEEAAKEAALEKFDDNLDDILEKFNESLDNTSKIYSSIREAITKDSASGRQFVVTL